MRRLWLTPTSDFPALKQKKNVRSRRGELFLEQQRPPSRWARGQKRGSVLARARLWPQTWREPLKHWTALAAAGVIAAATLVPAKAADISGAGATFPYPIYAKWADEYKKVTGNGLNYQSIGSGGGIKQIKAKTVTFGASRHAVAGQGARRNRSRPVPDGDGRHRARRQSRRHQARRTDHRWPDPRQDLPRRVSRHGMIAAIKKLNPSVKLPNQAIAIVHRSDGSGTTYNFAYYLVEVSADWKSKVGSQHLGRVAEWASAPKAMKALPTMSANQRLDRIRRVRLCQAKQADLHQNDQQGWQDGRRRPRGVPGGGRRMPIGAQPGYGVILANQPGAKSWPMTARP